MAIMDDSGWTIDPANLREVVTDQAVAEASLARASELDRPFWLRILGRLPEAAAETQAMLARPTLGNDPWPLLLHKSDIVRWLGEAEQAAIVLESAWPQARSRSRQGQAMHQLGLCWWEWGDLDAAARCFQLAVTLREPFDSPAEVEWSRQGLTRVREQCNVAVIVLAGGAGRRMGAGRATKTEARLAGWPLLDHVLLAAAAARRRIVVGPRPPRVVLGSPEFCREDPPGGGPVAAIAAGLATLAPDPGDTVLLFAADLPFIGRGVEQLRQAVTFGHRDAAAFVDISGKINYLAASWRAGPLMRAVSALGDPTGLPVRALYEHADATYLPDFDALSVDCDTVGDLASASQRIKLHSPGRLPTELLAWPRLELYCPS